MLQPLWALRELGAAPVFGELFERLVRFCRHYLYDRGGFVATPPAGRGGTWGVWQYVYALESTLQWARLTGDRQTMDLVRGEVEDVLLPFARRVGRVFPLIFSRAERRKVGPGDNHGVAGIYALLMLDLEEAFGAGGYRDEAREALRLLYNLPVGTVLQDAFLIGHAAHACARLADRDGEFLDIAAYLQAQALRQMIWYTDRTTAAARDFNVLCTVNACTPMLYPALFENIESMARTTAVMPSLGVSARMLTVLDHARRNNQCFYPACLPDRHRPTRILHVPFENVAMLEAPDTAYVGQEIYGAGWTFRAHLMWEAFGGCNDREIMVLNLDTYGEPLLLGQPDAAVRLAVFNTTAESRRVEVRLPHAAHGSCRVSVPDSQRPEHDLSVTDGCAALRMGPREFRILSVPVRNGRGNG